MRNSYSCFGVSPVLCLGLVVSLFGGRSSFRRDTIASIALRNRSQASGPSCMSSFGVAIGAVERLGFSKRAFKRRCSLRRAPLHEYRQETNNGNQSNQQPNPLPYGAGVLRHPALGGIAPSPGEFCGTCFNEANLPALNTSNGHPKLQTDSLHRFALEHAQHGLDLCTACNRFVAVIGSRFRRCKRWFAGIHAFSKELGSSAVFDYTIGRHGLGSC
jgi:hypothetical protein